MNNFADLTPNERMIIARDKITALQVAYRDNLANAHLALLGGGNNGHTKYTRLMTKAESQRAEITQWHQLFFEAAREERANQIEDGG